MKLLIPLLICLTCYGQLPVTPWTIPVPSSVDIPTSLGAIAFRLESKDVAASNNVAWWVDRIHGFAYTNNSATKQPTNSGPLGLGVWFTTGDWLQCSNVVAALLAPFQHTNQVMIVWNAQANGFNTLIGNSASEFLIGPLTGPTEFGSFSPQKNWATPVPVANAWHDVIYVGGADPVQVYTNGVASVTVSAAGSFTGDMLGANQAAHTDTYQGYIRRIIVWTNINAFTATTVSNLHYFNTNEQPSALFYSP